MKRIKYRKHRDRDIYFTKQLVAGAKAINATIINRSQQVDNSGFQIIIHDLTDGVILYEELCKSFDKAKKVIKSKFKELGVKIDDEVRKKVG